MKEAIPEECMRAFLIKSTRYDNRKFNDLRSFVFTPNALDSFKYSAIGNLGHNKIIIVLKETSSLPIVNKDNKEGNLNIKLIIENNSIADKPIVNNISIYSFINKLISNNLIRKAASNDQINYSLHIIIENQDGNIYDAISLCLKHFFSDETKINISFKNEFTTRTYSIVNDSLLSDPTDDEVKLSSSYFSIIKYQSGEFYMHKINGNFVGWDTIIKAESLIN